MTTKKIAAKPKNSSAFTSKSFATPRSRCTDPNQRSSLLKAAKVRSDARTMTRTAMLARTTTISPVGQRGAPGGVDPAGYARRGSLGVRGNEQTAATGVCRWMWVSGGEGLTRWDRPCQRVVVAVRALRHVVDDDPSQLRALRYRRQRGPGESEHRLVSGETFGACALPFTKRRADELDQGRLVTFFDRRARTLQTSAQRGHDLRCHRGGHVVDAGRFVGLPTREGGPGPGGLHH